MAGDTWLKPLEACSIDTSRPARAHASCWPGSTARARPRVQGHVAGAVSSLPTASSWRLSGSYPGDPDAVLRGTPLTLASLARSGEATGPLEIEGDPDVARRFQALLQAARPDWEEELARVVGDTAAHTIGNALRALTSWSKRAATSFSRDMAEFLQEESRDLPARGEVESFDADLDPAAHGAGANRVAARAYRRDHRQEPPLTGRWPAPGTIGRHPARFNAGAPRHRESAPPAAAVRHLPCAHRHGLQQIAVRIHLLGPARFALYLLPGLWWRPAHAPGSPSGCGARWRISAPSS